MRIGIDLMGGDNPPELLFPAILQTVKEFASHHTLLILATKSVIAPLSSLLSTLFSTPPPSISFQECEDVIMMTDDPLSALRRKKNSSLVVGIHLLKIKSIDALVSCGNTGALIASAALTLSLLPGISHPALLVALPKKNGTVAVLDAGGNLLNTAEDLVHFAFLGAAYQRAVQGIETPTVGLLNVGVESRKGTIEVRQAYEKLKMYCEEDAVPSLHFAGNIEGRDLFKGTVDVLVTDGFSGNVLLKTAEGVAAFIFESLQDRIQIGSMPDFEKSFADLKKQFNYAEYPGAIVCGIDGVVVKVHGNANAESLLIGIREAIDCVEKEVIVRIKDDYIRNSK